MRRKTKEFKVCNNSFNIKLGTVDKFNPISFYVEATSWITPLYNGDFENDLKPILSLFKDNIKKMIFDFNLSPKHIVDIDLKNKSLKQNCCNYLTIQIFFKQKNEIVSVVEIKDKMMDSILNLFLELKQTLNNNLFDTNVKKK